MNLTKKQVGALLKVVSADDTRPVIETLYITERDGTPVAVATDGFKAAILDAPELKSVVGKCVKWVELIKWYKLAGMRDLLDDTAILTMVSELDGVYPDIFKQIPTVDPSPMSAISVNPNYLVTMEVLSADNSLVWNVYGNGAPMVTTSEVGTLVVMPLRMRNV
ncbi:beta clamp domain-containing protein [Rhodococcus qingshengii]|uniref:hypothetical protein n=1 Tax=Rhodococcus qingshengii TaxID=334542 RepID=UPI002942B01E|nr:hypothetical protein [Rhodococcus qingshengii]WOI85961.1 hypothetical protein R0122_22545 [Rhodococcus qingshengii]